jgi:hypothetical protein
METILNARVVFLYILGSCLMPYPTPHRRRALGGSSGAGRGAAGPERATQAERAEYRRRLANWKEQSDAWYEQRDKLAASPHQPRAHGPVWSTLTTNGAHVIRPQRVDRGDYLPVGETIYTEWYLDPIPKPGDELIVKALRCRVEKSQLPADAPARLLTLTVLGHRRAR